MYQTMIKYAQDLAMQKQNSGQLNANDTICVVCASSKRIYVGMNYPQMHNGMMINMHAEIDAIQKMRAGGDMIAEFLLLVSANTGQALLPCDGCVNFILSQEPNNAYCQIVFPDRMIPITQVGRVNGSVNMPYNNAAPVGGGQMYGGGGSIYNGAMPQRGSIYNNGGSNYLGQGAKIKKSGGNKLKGKVGDLINAGKDVGNEEVKESAFMSRLFNDDE